MIAAMVAAIALVGFTVKDAYVLFRRLRGERLSTQLVLSHLNVPASKVYFVGAPGKNRVCGRIELVFDDWLYPVFESVHAAEPRSIWLRRALTDGSVRFAVTPSSEPRIDGVDEPLSALVYTPRFHVGPRYVWEQLRALGPR